MFRKRQTSRGRDAARRLAVQSLETRRLLAASFGWDGPGLGDAELTYSIVNSPPSLTQAETTAAIESALAVWSEVVDITFTPTTQRGLRDSLDISFTHIDGPGQTLAQAYFPDDVNPARIAGDVQFDVSETWEVGNALGNRAYDLVWVAVHEIGHALGLNHDESRDAVLAASVSPSQEFSELSTSDVAAIRGLYAAADVTDNLATDEPETTVTTVSQGEAEPSSTDVDEDTPSEEIPEVEPPADETPSRRRRWWVRSYWFRFRGWFEVNMRVNFNAGNFSRGNIDVRGDESSERPLDERGIAESADRQAFGTHRDAVDQVLARWAIQRFYR